MTRVSFEIQGVAIACGSVDPAEFEGGVDDVVETLVEEIFYDINGYVDWDMDAVREVAELIVAARDG